MCFGYPNFHLCRAEPHLAAFNYLLANAELDQILVIIRRASLCLDSKFFNKP